MRVELSWTESALSTLHQIRGNGCLGIRKVDSEREESTSTLIGLPRLWTVGNKFLLFLSHPVHLN